MNRKYNWQPVEDAYVRVIDERISLKEISERFNIPYQTVRRYAAVHEWERKRIEYAEPFWLKKWIRNARNPYIKAKFIQRLENCKRDESQSRPINF